MPRLFPVLLLGVLLPTLCLEFGCGQTKTPPPNTVAATTGKVKLTVDFDGRIPTKQVELTLKEGMSALDALVAAESQEIQAEISGEGEAAFVRSINGIANETPGEASKNWIYYVNGKQGKRSAGVYTLAPGDAMIWRFEKYE